MRCGGACWILVGLVVAVRDTRWHMAILSTSFGYITTRLLSLAWKVTGTTTRHRHGHRHNTGTGTGTQALLDQAITAHVRWVLVHLSIETHQQGDQRRKYEKRGEHSQHGNSLILGAAPGFGHSLWVILHGFRGSHFLSCWFWFSSYSHRHPG